MRRRAGSESLFCHWFGLVAGPQIYRKFCSAFPKQGNGWAHANENLRQNVMHWTGFRDRRSETCSAGMDGPPPGLWVNAQEHTTAILHIGFLREFPVLVLPKAEQVPVRVARSKFQREIDRTTPIPIDALAAKVGGRDGR